MGYYVYLYGHLLLNNDQATLHYAFDAVDHDRVIPVAPVSIATQVTKVTLDGAPWAWWTGGNSLHIPAHVGGDFAVTFKRLIMDVGGAAHAVLPDRMRLEQNYPNPFNPSTTLTFALPHGGRAVIRVHDLLGREVATILDEDMEAGTHTVNFDGSGLSSGIYLYRLEANGVQLTRTMALLK